MATRTYLPTGLSLMLSPFEYDMNAHVLFKILKFHSTEVRTTLISLLKMRWYIDKTAVLKPVTQYLLNGYAGSPKIACPAKM
ncbi:hypothetical protein DVH05_004899 [Phytophthora capsici]|nr:hypothetical protein DVH05_004899 [Phytophthora capsici]